METDRLPENFVSSVLGAGPWISAQSPGVNSSHSDCPVLPRRAPHAHAHLHVMHVHNSPGWSPHPAFLLSHGKAPASSGSLKGHPPEIGLREHHGWE